MISSVAMKLTWFRVTAVAMFSFAAGSFMTSHLTPQKVEAQSNRVYELRTYHVLPGRLPALVSRFRDHTRRIFDNHQMSSVGYWVPQDSPAKDNTLIYIITHPSREAATANWKAFGADPEWQKVAADSQMDGKIVEKVDSTFMDPTDFSKLK